MAHKKRAFLIWRGPILFKKGPNKKSNSFSYQQRLFFRAKNRSLKEHFVWENDWLILWWEEKVFVEATWKMMTMKYGLSSIKSGVILVLYNKCRINIKTKRPFSTKVYKCQKASIKSKCSFCISKRSGYSGCSFHIFIEIRMEYDH